MVNTVKKLPETGYKCAAFIGITGLMKAPEMLCKPVEREARTLPLINAPLPWMSGHDNMGGEYLIAQAFQNNASADVNAFDAPDLAAPVQGEFNEAGPDTSPAGSLHRVSAMFRIAETRIVGRSKLSCADNSLSRPVLRRPYLSGRNHTRLHKRGGKTPVREFAIRPRYGPLNFLFGNRQ